MGGQLGTTHVQQLPPVEYINGMGAHLPGLARCVIKDVHLAGEPFTRRLFLARNGDLKRCFYSCLSFQRQLNTDMLQ